MATSKKATVKETELPKENLEPVKDTVTPVEPLNAEELKEVMKKYESIPVVTNEIKHEWVYGEELSNEEKLLNFIENSQSNPVRLNEFLKSLYITDIRTEPNSYKQLGVSKAIKVMLGNLSNAGKVSIANMEHLKLGKPYHHGEQQLAMNHSLDTVILFAQK
jgi:hypothetical protein